MVLTGSRLWLYYSTPMGSASSGKSSEYFEKLSFHPSQPPSRVYTNEWVRKVGGLMGGRLNFDPHPQEYSIIAVGG